MKNLFTLSALCAATLLAIAANAAPVPNGLDHGGITVAREAESGGRGGDDGKGHRLSDEAPATMIAREAESGGRGGDDGKGHRLSDDAPATTIAREAESGGRGGDDGKGHRLSDGQPGDQVARAETSHGGKRRPAGKAGA